uniref:Protein OSB1 n=1 Tax=Rhizophora mucronata TaxID=61149 RepID=A0A2P2Q5U2_RHIMU
MNRTCRVGFLIRHLSSFSFQRISPFSSSAGASLKLLSSSSDEEETGEVGSPVYRHVLRTQRPTTIWRRPQFENSVSLIGSVDRPLQLYNAKAARSGAYTVLKVKEPEKSFASFRILLEIRENMSQMCVEHLKPNDNIFVSGRLGFYTKADKSGILRSMSKVTVNELSYVTQCDQGPGYQNHKKSLLGACEKSKELQSKGGETRLERHKNRLYLWQVFFSNPHEWWDNRNNKRNPRAPDFKHKDTGEALWLGSNDPPWVKRQLQVIDSEMALPYHGEDARPRSRISQWLYDE